MKPLFPFAFPKMIPAVPPMRFVEQHDRCQFRLFFIGRIIDKLNPDAGGWSIKYLALGIVRGLARPDHVQA